MLRLALQTSLRAWQVITIFSQPVAMEDAAFVPRVFQLNEDAIGKAHHRKILGIAQRDGVASCNGLSRTSPMATRKHQEQCHEHSARKQDSMRPP